MSRVLPILFNTEMVQAILDGRKTVTRRVIKPQPIYSENEGFSWKGYAYGTDLPPTIKGASYNFRCAAPYKAGDILYVRETWGEGYHGYIYKADDKLIDLPEFKESSKMIYRPSIHMPKEAARIFLKVKDVRVERLQDITEKQAEKEGFIDTAEYCVGNTARGHFRNLWDSTIKKADIDRHSWSANPWVWVIEFERCEKPEGGNEKRD